mgnify:CR=1 FL=1
MPYGNLNLAMREAVRPFVLGKTVHDLGAGDCDHARTLVGLGAGSVVAIDKADAPRLAKGVTYIRSLIADVPLPETVPVVFLGWPQNYVIPGLLEWLHRAETIIYLGSNLNGTACAFPDVFRHFLTRELAVYIEDRQNNLLVLRETLATPRSPVLEERGCFSDEILTL